MALVRALVLIGLVWLAAAGEAAQARRRQPRPVGRGTRPESGDTAGLQKVPVVRDTTH
jgi:hypothetical protein